jgi:hypothetical protein
MQIWLLLIVAKQESRREGRTMILETAENNYLMERRMFV